jgi:hypothetical protein
MLCWPRDLVKRRFNKIKQCPSIAARHGRLAVGYLALDPPLTSHL